MCVCVDESDHVHAISFEYYIKVVPTTYESLSGHKTRTYQFTASSNWLIGHVQVPAVYFRFDLSPITVQFSQKQTTFSHFIVQVLSSYECTITITITIRHRPSMFQCSKHDAVIKFHSYRAYHHMSFLVHPHLHLHPHLHPIHFELAPVSQVCAIIGGVFTMLGLASQFVHRSLAHVIKKAQQGKLG